MSRLLFIALLTISHFLPAQNRVDFIREAIDFSIDSNKFSTNGIYYFVNNTDKEVQQSILFPFAESADSVKTKRVYNLTYNTNLPYQNVKNGIRFRIFILPNDTISVNISYSQNTDKENIYILESTQAWNKPLQKANYSLTFDASVKIDSLSLTPDTLINNVYYWERINFFPNENYVVWVK